MNAPMLPLIRRDRNADRPEAERVGEVLLIWMSDELDCRLPWLGHLDERGQWWFVDSGMARDVTHWAYRPEVRQ